MRVIYEIDSTLYNTKKKQTRTERGWVEEYYYSFFKNLIRKAKQPLAIYRYQLSSSFVYL